MGAHPLFSTLSRRGLNPIKLAYSPRPPDNGLGQYVSSPGNRAYCYAELAVAARRDRTIVQCLFLLPWSPSNLLWRLWPAVVHLDSVLSPVSYDVVQKPWFWSLDESYISVDVKEFDVTLLLLVYLSHWLSTNVQLVERYWSACMWTGTRCNFSGKITLPNSSAILPEMCHLIWSVLTVSAVRFSKLATTNNWIISWTFSSFRKFASAGQCSKNFRWNFFSDYCCFSGKIRAEISQVGAVVIVLWLTLGWCLDALYSRGVTLPCSCSTAWELLGVHWSQCRATTSLTTTSTGAAYIWHHIHRWWSIITSLSLILSIRVRSRADPSL